jgi:hypothetical protein
MHIIKSVGVLSVAKLLGLVYGCMGLLFAPFFYSSASLDRWQAKATLLISGIFGVIFRNSHPVLYGAMGVRSGRDRCTALQVVRTMGG